VPRRKLVKKLSPEEEELNRKKKELRGLEDRFAELELTLNALRVDVGAFLFSVQAAVGEGILEEAILRRRLADALLAIDPDNKEYQTQAKKAREDAEEAQHEHDAFAGRPGASSTYADFESARKARASDEVRDLYLKLVKLAHPDLTTDPEEKERRTRFMQEVNAAYEAGDYQRLEDLHRGWIGSLESFDGEDIGDQLVRVIRQISLVQERMAAVEAEFAELMNTADYGMFEEARDRGFEDYLSTLTAAADIENDRLKAGIDQVSRQTEEILDPSSG
jgi:hypothetical protein